jgi:hypothetical protein
MKWGYYIATDIYMKSNIFKCTGNYVIANNVKNVNPFMFFNLFAYE